MRCRGCWDGKYIPRPNPSDFLGDFRVREPKVIRAATEAFTGEELS